MDTDSSGADESEILTSNSLLLIGMRQENLSDKDVILSSPLSPSETSSLLSLASLDKSVNEDGDSEKCVIGFNDCQNDPPEKCVNVVDGSDLSMSISIGNEAYITNSDDSNSGDSNSYEERTLLYLSQFSGKTRKYQYESSDCIVMSSFSLSTSFSISHDQSIADYSNNPCLLSEDDCSSDEYVENVTKYLENMLRNSVILSPNTDNSFQTNSSSELLSPDITINAQRKELDFCLTDGQDIMLSSLDIKKAEQKIMNSLTTPEKDGKLLLIDSELGRQSGLRIELDSSDDTKGMKQRADKECFYGNEKSKGQDEQRIKEEPKNSGKYTDSSLIGKKCNIKCSLNSIEDANSLLKTGESNLVDGSVSLDKSDVTTKGDSLVDEVLQKSGCVTNINCSVSNTLRDVGECEGLRDSPLSPDTDKVLPEVQIECFDYNENSEITLSCLVSEDDGEYSSDSYEIHVNRYLSMMAEKIKVIKTPILTDDNDLINVRSRYFSNESNLLSSLDKNCSEERVMYFDVSKQSESSVNKGSEFEMNYSNLGMITSTPCVTTNSSALKWRNSNVQNGCKKSVSFNFNKQVPYSLSRPSSLSSSVELGDDDQNHQPNSASCFEGGDKELPTLSSSPPSLFPPSDLLTLRSDLEDESSDEYERTINEYLTKKYSMGANASNYYFTFSENSHEVNFPIEQSVIKIKHSNTPSSIPTVNVCDSSSDSDSVNCTSDESDFMPTPSRRTVTLHKRRLWKLLEMEMNKELRDIKRKSKLKRSNSSESGEISDGVIRVDLNKDRMRLKKSYARKKQKFSTVRNLERDGIVKIYECDEFLITTDNNEKKAAFNFEEDERNDKDKSNKDSRFLSRVKCVRTEFYKNIHMSYLKKSLVNSNNNVSTNYGSEYPPDDEVQDVSIFNLFCDICDVKFNNYINLDRHMVHCHEGKITDICEKCGMSFCCKEDFEKHFQDIHGSNSLARISCHLCLNIFDDFQFDFLHHLKEDHKFLDLYQFKCTKCNMMFANEFMLKDHLSNSCFFCYICKNYRARNIQSYKNHLLFHYKIHSYKCQYCGKMYVTQRGCRNHIKVKHKNDLKYNCNKCDKKFPLKNILDEHYYRCHNVSVFKCDICSKIYRSIYTLNTHKKYHHPVVNSVHCDVDNYTCNFCDMNFNRKQLICEHLDYKLCICPWCNMSFNCVTKLGEHVAIHRSKCDYKLVCTHCSHKVSTLQQYKRHFILSHPCIYGQFYPNSIKCDRCGRICSSKHHLKKHQRISCMQPKLKTEQPKKLYNKSVCHKDKNEISNDSGTVLVCKYCNKTFVSSYSFYNHTERNSTTCLKCHCRFVCITLLDEHKVMVHDSMACKNIAVLSTSKTGDGENFSLENSNLTIKDRKRCDLLNSDEKNISDYENSTVMFPHVCETCNNKFRTETCLLNHIKIAHGNKNKVNKSQKKLYCCQFCDNKYLRKILLFNHNKLCNKFVCKFCNNIFMFKYSYKIHFMFCRKCIFCDEVFVCCYLFVKHINISHERILDNYVITYECPDCYNSISTVDGFIEHFVSSHPVNDRVMMEMFDRKIVIFVSRNAKTLNHIAVENSCFVRNIPKSNCALSNSDSVVELFSKKSFISLSNLDCVATSSGEICNIDEELQQKNESVRCKNFDAQTAKYKNVAVSECDSSSNLNTSGSNFDGKSCDNHDCDLNDFSLIIEDSISNDQKVSCLRNSVVSKHIENIIDDELPTSSNALL